ADVARRTRGAAVDAVAIAGGSAVGVAGLGVDAGAVAVDEACLAGQHAGAVRAHVAPRAGVAGRAAIVDVRLDRGATSVAARAADGGVGAVAGVRARHGAPGLANALG